MLSLERLDTKLVFAHKRGQTLSGTESLNFGTYNPDSVQELEPLLLFSPQVHPFIEFFSVFCLSTALLQFQPRPGLEGGAVAPRCADLGPFRSVSPKPGLARGNSCRGFMEAVGEKAEAGGGGGAPPLLHIIPAA